MVNIGTAKLGLRDVNLDVMKFLACSIVNPTVLVKPENKQHKNHAFKCKFLEIFP